MSATKTKIAVLFDKVYAEKELKDKTILYLRQEIAQRLVRKKHMSIHLVTALAVFVLVITLGGYAFAAYLTPIAYIDMDVNPSFELVVNKFGRVIYSRAYNADGEKLLSGTSLVHKTYKQAVTILFDVIAGSQYIDEYGLVAITVQASNADNEKKMVSDLNAIVDTMLETHYASAIKDIFPVSDETKMHANSCHMTPAKYLAIEQLMAIDSSASFDECSMHSVGELRDYIGEHTNDHHCDHEQAHDCHETDDYSILTGENAHCKAH